MDAAKKKRKRSKAPVPRFKIVTFYPDAQTTEILESWRKKEINVSMHICNAITEFHRNNYPFDDEQEN